MSVIKIVNAEVGDLSLYELRVRPVFGMMGAGEPTERGVKRELERLQKPKNEHGKSQFFLQAGVITEFPIPLIRVDAFFLSTWKPNEDTMSRLSLIWLVDSFEDVFSAEIKSLLRDLKWSNYADPFEFN